MLPWGSKKTDGDEGDLELEEVEGGMGANDMRNSRMGGPSQRDLTGGLYMLPCGAIGSTRGTSDIKTYLTDLFAVALGFVLVVTPAVMVWFTAEYIVWIYLAVSLYMGPVTLAVYAFGKFHALFTALRFARKHEDIGIFDFIGRRWVSVFFALLLVALDLCIVALLVRPAVLWEAADSVAEMEDGPPEQPYHAPEHHVTSTGNSMTNLHLNNVIPLSSRHVLRIH